MGAPLNIGWAMFLLCFHLIAELIPMTILFFYQFQSNMLWLKTKQAVSVCKAANQDNPYACTGIKTAAKALRSEYEDDDDDSSYYAEDEP